MRGEWAYFKSYFSKDTCERILDKGLQLPAKDAQLGVAGEGTASDYRKSKIRFIQKDNQDFQFLFSDLWYAARWANNDFFDFHLSDITYLQLAEYDASYGGEYKKHHDVFWMNNDPRFHRKLTCVVQLSDPSTYDGGDFEVYDTTTTLPAEEIRAQGTIIIIPSFIPHAALPITRGVRYSLAAWFDGPKWR